MKNCDILIPDCPIWLKNTGRGGRRVEESWHRNDLCRALRSSKGAREVWFVTKPAHTTAPRLHMHASSIRAQGQRACFVFGHAVTSVCGSWAICDSAFCRGETQNGQHPCSQNHVQNQPSPGYLGNKIFFSPLNIVCATRNYSAKKIQL